MKKTTYFIYWNGFLQISCDKKRAKNYFKNHFSLNKFTLSSNLESNININNFIKN